MALKQRNERVDILRGIAMLMVVMGHTMTGCTTGAESTLLFNFIWSIQMPLFFLISGYVTNYSCAPTSYDELKLQILKRTRAYLLPWVVWTFLIRGMVFGEHGYFDIPYLLWHMDTGYWFLVSLWSISIIYIMAQYLSSKLGKYRLLCLCISYATGAVMLLCVGLVAGMSFLAIKQTVYYMVFFAIGVAAGYVQNVTPQMDNVAHLRHAAVCVCVVFYSVLLLQYSFYEISDSLQGIALRGIASLLGCVCMAALGSRVNPYGACGRIIVWIGRNSLGIYLSHYLLLCIVKPTILPCMNSFNGILLVLVNFTATISLSSVTAKILDMNRFVRRLCLGK